MIFVFFLFLRIQTLQLHCFKEEISLFKAKFIVLGMMNCFKVCIFLEHGKNEIVQVKVSLGTINKDKNNMFSFSLFQ